MSLDLLTIAAAALLAAQTSAPRNSTPAKDPTPAITLTGCVSADPTTPGAYTFFDPKTGNNYKLTGPETEKLADKRWDIVVGKGARRLTIRGGLVPSANVAAQGGALDPGQDAGSLRSGPPADAKASMREFRPTTLLAASGICR